MTAERAARCLRRRTALARHSADARYRVLVRRTLQGIGLRPFVGRLATALQRTGAVRNTDDGMEIDSGGLRHRVARALRQLRAAAPPGAAVARVGARALPPRRGNGFRIAPRDARRARTRGIVAAAQREERA